MPRLQNERNPAFLGMGDVKNQEDREGNELSCALPEPRVGLSGKFPPLPSLQQEFWWELDQPLDG